MKRLSLLRALLRLTIVATLPAIVLWVARPGVSARTPTGISKSAVDAPRVGRVSSATPDAAKLRVMRDYGNLPLSFEANRGQTDRRVKFLSRGHGYTLFLTPNEAVLALSKSPPQAEPPDASQARLFQREKTITTALRIKLVGGNPRARVAGTEELPGKSNYFIGSDPKKWRTNVANYRKVCYQDVYPGVDLVYYGNQGQLEYDFVVAPGADPKAIQLAVAAMSPSPNGGRRPPLQIAASGDLVVGTDGGEVRFHKPIVYQQDGDGRKHYIDGHYALRASESKIENLKSAISFEVASYDRSRPLVIDPVLSYSTYLGGSGVDSGLGIAVDAGGNAYVTGTTSSADFPVYPNPGAFQTASSGGSRAGFVTKLNATGTGLIYSTYLGGGNDFMSNAIAVDAGGNAYVTGVTYSNNFPTTSGAYQSCSGAGPGAGNGYVTKLNPTGSGLVYSTCFVGATGFAIAVDASGNAYVTGTAGPPFPTTPGAFQSSAAGNGSDAFVTKLNPTGSVLVYSSYLGGNGDDIGFGIAVDAAGSAYVAGGTRSATFPTTLGAFQTRFSGGTGSVVEGFVSKVNPSGTALVYSTYLGGTGDGSAGAIAVDAGGNAYVIGNTRSFNFPTSPGFPTTPGAFQTTFGGDVDVTVTKLNSAGSGLVYSTFLGGSGVDACTCGIALDTSGNAYVEGVTGSTDFPTLAPIQASNGGGFDAFVAKLNAAGNALLYSTYLGGNGSDAANGGGIALDGNGNAYVVGVTSSTNFPTTTGAFQTAFGGGAFDAYVAKISDQPPNSSPSAAADSSLITVNEGQSASNSGSYSDSNSGDDVVIATSLGTVTKTGTNSGTWSWSFATTDGPTLSQTVTITADDGHGGTATTTFQLTVNNVAPAVTVNLTASSINENGTVGLTGLFTDPGILDTHTVSIDWADGSTPTGLSLAAGVLAFGATHQYLDDNPTLTASDNYPISVRVADKDNGVGSALTSVTVNNVTPVITSFTGPTSPLALGTLVTLTAAFTDVGTQDTHTCLFSWDDYSISAGTIAETPGSGTCTGTHLYAAAGVYGVTVTVTDDDTGSGTSIFQFVVVYDPSAGFVTGGGWINSPAGAYAENPSLAGKATFGFVSKYRKGATVPTGNTEFQFQVANFNFHSDTYEWLVVSGPKAQYKGTGTVNGSGNYGFLLTATDGQRPGGSGVDRFRIKIINKTTNAVVYDNVGGSDDIDSANPQEIAGGSIIIQSQ